MKVNGERMIRARQGREGPEISVNDRWRSKRLTLSYTAAWLESSMQIHDDM